MFFFFNDTATTEIYTLSLHDALPILLRSVLDPILPSRDGADLPEAEADPDPFGARAVPHGLLRQGHPDDPRAPRSEEHTSELQSRQYLVCRLLLEKKKNKH